MIFIFNVEISARFLISTLGEVKREIRLARFNNIDAPVRYNFIKNLFTTKSREFKSLFFIGQTSRPYNKIGTISKQESE